ncbi:MAG: PHB depolymerase family esterase [Byssovorax sp.]
MKLLVAKTRASLAASAALLVAAAGLGACETGPDPLVGTGGNGGGSSSASSASTGGDAAASSSSASGTSGTGGPLPACATTTFGGAERPVKLHVPPTYACDKAAPLVIMLHGYGVTSGSEEAYLNLLVESDKRGFLYAAPDGVKDATTSEYWNATDACCDYYGAKVDDSAYLSGLITDVEAAYNVDAKRVYIVGHSAGGFMAHRMACDHGDQLAAVVSLEGAMYQDPTKCPGKTPVSVLEIHGTSDAVIAYGGGLIGGNAFPSAPTTASDWAKIDGCAAADSSAAPLDLDASLPGNETSIAAYLGCNGGASVQLWTVKGGAHFPTLSPSFAPSVLDFLYAQKKP